MSDVRYGQTAAGPVVENDHIRVTVHLNKGTFDLTPVDGTQPTIHDAPTFVSLTNGTTFSSRGSGIESEGTTPLENAHGHGLALHLRRKQDEDEPELALTLTVYENQPFIVAVSGIVNASRAPLHIASFRVLDSAGIDLGSPAREWRLYKEGWQNWSPALVLGVSGKDVYMSPPVIGPTTQPPQQDSRFVSEMVTAIADHARHRAVTAGFVSTADQFSQLWLDREAQSLTAASYTDGVELPPGARLSSERLLVDLSSDPLVSLQRYGDALSREMQAAPWPHPVSGWCSWYYYWQGVSEQHILANLEDLAGRRTSCRSNTSRLTTATRQASATGSR